MWSTSGSYTGGSDNGYKRGEKWIFRTMCLSEWDSLPAAVYLLFQGRMGWETAATGNTYLWWCKWHSGIASFKRIYSFGWFEEKHWPGSLVCYIWWNFKLSWYRYVCLKKGHSCIEKRKKAAYHTGWHLCHYIQSKVVSEASQLWCLSVGG